MVKQLDVVYERGVLRSLEPLALREKQRVRVTVDVKVGAGALEASVTTALVNDRRAEFAWLAKEAGPYAGQWVALDGAGWWRTEKICRRCVRRRLPREWGDRC